MSIPSKLNPLNLRRRVRTHLGCLLKDHLTADDRVADTGCGSRPFSAILSCIGCANIGIDTQAGFYGTQSLDVIGTADAVPLVDRSVDAVLSSQVIEHLPDTDLAFREISRVLKAAGCYLFLSRSCTPCTRHPMITSGLPPTDSNSFAVVST
jgi:ubiquinone/menaquinone biosynthesis C-methylase UbiE